MTRAISLAHQWAGPPVIFSKFGDKDESDKFLTYLISPSFDSLPSVSTGYGLGGGQPYLDIP